MFSKIIHSTLHVYFDVYSSASLKAHETKGLNNTLKVSLGNERESEVWVERKEGTVGPVTWILFLSVSTCQRLVWTGLVSSCLQHKDFSLVETSCAKPTFSQSLTALFIPSPPSLLSVSHTVWKQGGNGRGKVWHLFLTQHMCVCLKIVWRANWGLFLLMRVWLRHTPDSPECEQMPGSRGGWIVGRDSHFVYLHCLRLHRTFTKDQILAQQSW